MDPITVAIGGTVIVIGVAGAIRSKKKKKGSRDPLGKKEKMQSIRHAGKRH